MVPTSHKYTTSDPAFDKTHGVLKNKLDLTDAQALENAETHALILAYDQAAQSYSDNHAFTAADVCRLHEMFLGDIYSWAGTYRTIDLSSPDIRWCHAAFIAREMQRFDDMLQKATPLSSNLSCEDIIATIAEIHGELIVIHPFRDGNGRTTRLLCDLLFMQAGIAPLSPTAFNDKETQQQYFAAIRDVWVRSDYEKLINLMTRLLAG